jgi:hypothetical protein
LLDAFHSLGFKWNRLLQLPYLYHVAVYWGEENKADNLLFSLIGFNTQQMTPEHSYPYQEI